MSGAVINNVFGLYPQTVPCNNDWLDCKNEIITLTIFNFYLKENFVILAVLAKKI